MDAREEIQLAVRLAAMGKDYRRGLEEAREICNMEAAGPNMFSFAIRARITALDAEPKAESAGEIDVADQKLVDDAGRKAMAGLTFTPLEANLDFARRVAMEALNEALITVGAKLDTRQANGIIDRAIERASVQQQDREGAK